MGGRITKKYKFILLGFETRYIKTDTKPMIWGYKFILLGFETLRT